MKNWINLSIISVFLLTTHIIHAQQPDGQKTNSNRGTPIVRVFFDFRTSITKHNYESAFEVKRAYLGYDYKFDENFSVIVKLDIGSPDDKSPYSLIKRYAYFKNAALKFKKGKFEANLGLIDLRKFKLQEHFWGYRYIYKSFMDEHYFGPSADIGYFMKYEFTDFLSADITIMNGEGYAQLQADNTYKGGFGIIFEPLENFIVRIYYDITSREIAESTIALFTGYRFKDYFSAGFEYNMKYNENYYNNHNLEGFSFYGTFYLSEKFQLFGRYDRLISNKITDEDRPWNLVNDGTAIIGGIQYQLLKQIKIALNYQDWYPYAKNATNEAYIYLNFEYKINE